MACDNLRDGRGPEAHIVDIGYQAVPDGTVAGVNHTAAAGCNVLKDAILNGLITAGVPRRGEVILVGMTWHDRADATKIVDSFVRAYMALEVTKASKEVEDKLTTLENEQKLLYQKLEDDRAQISGMAAESPSNSIT